MGEKEEEEYEEEKGKRGPRGKPTSFFSKCSGSCTRTCPVEGPTFDRIWVILQHALPVRLKATGVYPLKILPGTSGITETLALKERHTLRDASLESTRQSPLFGLLTGLRPATLIPTMSPGTATSKSSWCISMEST
jgi:hypothetical protein